MKITSPFVGILALILLIAVPVGGAPTLQAGSYANYNLNATLSFPPPICELTSTSNTDMMIVDCPKLAVIPPTVNVTGTLGWTATGLNSTTVALNVTRDVTISAEGLMVPTIHKMDSFNESVNLASRIISVMPLLRTELDEAFQTDQTMIASSLPIGMDPSSTMTTVESAIRESPSVYTMWWVNGPLSANQTVPVLALATNVTRSAMVNLGELGTRTAWFLVFNVTKPFPQPDAALTSTTWTNGSVGVAFTFYYDERSDLLLSATATIHVGFEEATTIQPTQCNPSTGTALIWCPASTTSTGSVTMTRLFGFNINASLALASTNLNLDQRMTPPGPSGSSTTGSGSNSGAGSGNGGGSGTGSGYGSGSGTGAGTGTGTTQGSGSGTNGGTGSGTGSNSGNTPQSTVARPSSMPLWIYWILSAVAVVIVVTGLLFVRRRRSSQAQTPAKSASN